ncbi:MAG: dihydroneopterin aldolase [Planctomycetes bacterium]|nr:dihydroneopterin aldolase [Planctomycetota bacterium]
MKDWIEIFDLRVRTLIGVEDWERREKQEILVSVRLLTDIRRAAASDDLDHSLNYRDVSKRILRFAETFDGRLVERFAEEVARLCVAEFHAPKVQVRVEKPGALRFARSVGVAIEREASDYDPK